MSRLCAVWLPVCFLLVSCAKPPEPEPARSPNSSPAKALNPQLAEDVGVLREYLRKPNTPCFQEVANLSDYRDKGKVDRLEDGRFFAACEVVLASYERLADVHEVFDLLWARKGDRSRFLPTAVRELANPDRVVRGYAALLLRGIGSQAQAPALVPILSDVDESNALHAAIALAAFGGPDELAAMDAWLQGDGRDALGIRDPINAAFMKERITQYRAEFAERLAKQANMPAKAGLRLP